MISLDMKQPYHLRSLDKKKSYYLMSPNKKTIISLWLFRLGDTHLISASSG